MSTAVEVYEYFESRFRIWRGPAPESNRRSPLNLAEPAAFL